MNLGYEVAHSCAKGWAGAHDIRLTFSSPAAYLGAPAGAGVPPDNRRPIQGIGSLRYLFEEYAFDTDRRELHRGHGRSRDNSTRRGTFNYLQKRSG
jgi:hypothetical protein